MHKSSVQIEVTPRFTDIKGFMSFCGLGKNSAVNLAKKIGCIRKFGSRTMYDLKKADEYFDLHNNDDADGAEGVGA